ncbi:hypothetical protein [uncultured Phenylobacterium sp.]|uniref:hypothetical protein n=1 Tax=uncultured Phenylobacterium sp. TaxID=349273 RepID=UPI0026013BEE|nr:hypothetical protein [uncultured Phenylobacterium sp.]
MSDALVQRTRAAEQRPASGSRAVPTGYGLLLGAAVSCSFWAGIFWLAQQVFG